MFEFKKYMIQDEETSEVIATIKETFGGSLFEPPCTLRNNSINTIISPGNYLL